jgi:hypothetical protein
MEFQDSLASSGGISRNKAMADATVGYALSDSDAAKRGGAVIAVPGGPDGKSHFQEDLVIEKKSGMKNEPAPSIGSPEAEGAMIPFHDHSSEPP